MQYCKIEGMENRSCRVTITVNIHSDMSWDVFFHDRKLPTGIPLLSGFPDHITSSDVAMKLFSAVDSAFTCIGSPDEKFINMCSMRGGEVRGDRGHGDVVAYIDKTLVTDASGKVFSCSVRRNDCELLCSQPGRCTSCNTFRSSLRKTLSRHQREGVLDPTATNSHTSYSNLSSAEKDARMQNLHQSLKLATKQVEALREKVKGLIEEQSIALQEADSCDLTTIVTEVSPMVKEKFPVHTPQRIFWDQQVGFHKESPFRHSYRYAEMKPN